MIGERAGTPGGNSFETPRIASPCGVRPRPALGIVATVGITLGMLASASGCAALRSAWVSSERPAAKSTVSPVVEPLAEGEQEELSAIEDFLARTQQYRSASPPMSSAPHGAIVREETTPQIRMSSTPGAANVPAADIAFANKQVTIGDSISGGPKLAIPALQAVSILWADPDHSTEPQAAAMNTTNSPLEAQPDESPESWDRLLQHLQSRAQEYQDFDAEWRLKAAQLALDRDEEAAAVSTSLPEGARNLVGAVMNVAIAVRNLARNPMLTGEEALRHLETLREVVSDRADPTVSMVALCRRVVTFGTYEEMVDQDMVAGHSIQTIVYSEIRNLRSVQTDDGRYETRLASRLEVLTADGTSVWQRDEPEIIDTCRRRRHDFFIAQRVTLPPTLSAGDYVLKVLVEDTLSGRADEASHSFTISSPISVANGR